MAQQRGKDESLRKVLDKMFAHIDKNKVPTGLLRDYAEEYEDLDIFTGIMPLTEHKAEPQSLASAFGKNYFVNNESQEHSSFLKEKQVNKWILSRLSTLIVGPINAYTNAQYFLTNAIGVTSWSTDNSKIATINSSGILTAKGKGICFVEASNNGIKYSMPIVVGNPRYILKGSYSPGGYLLKAECLDNEFKNSQDLINDAFKFKWGY